MEQVSLSSIVLKINIHMSLISVDLHHCCSLIIKKYLSINPFMNLSRRNGCASETKITNDRILPFTHFQRPHPKLTNKRTQRNKLKQPQIYSLHNHTTFNFVSRTLLLRSGFRKTPDTLGCTGFYLQRCLRFCPT